MDTTITTIDHFSMSIDIITKPVFLFNSALINPWEIIGKYWSLQKFLHLIELNTKHQFTITRDYVI
jgi:hypothetical protein